MTDYSADIRQTAKIVGVSDDHEAVAACEKVVQQELVHRLLNLLGFAAGQLAVFQGASEAPLSES